MLTDRGLALYLTTLTLLALVALFAPSLDLVLPLALILIIMGVDSVYTVKNIRKNIEIERTIDLREVKVGDRVKVVLIVSSKRTLYVKIYDDIPYGMLVHGKPYGKKLLKPNSPLRIEYYVTPLLNGVYVWRKVYMEVMDPLHLFKYNVEFPILSKIHVREEPKVSPHITLPLKVLSKLKRSKPYFDHVREYTIGDSLKLIVPKSIIKYRVPKVKVLGVEAEKTKKYTIHVLSILGPWFIINDALRNKLLYLLKLLLPTLSRYASSLSLTIISKEKLISVILTHENINSILDKMQTLTPATSIEEVKLPTFTKADIVYVISDPYTLSKITLELSKHVLTGFMTLIILSPTPPLYTKSSIRVLEKIINQYYSSIHEASRRLWRHSEVLTI